MRPIDLLTLLASLRDVFRKREAASDKRAKAEDDYRSNVVVALNELKAEIERQGAAANQRPRHDSEKVWVGRLGLAVNAITMGAVIYYACVAHMQLEEMIGATKLTAESVDISRRALDIGNRAWVFGTLSSTRAPYIADGPPGNPTFIFTLRNAGKSPALTVHHGVVCAFSAGKPEATFGQGENLVLPADTTSDDRKLKCLFMKPEEVESFRSKSRTFYVWLIMLYRDPMTTKEDRVSMECWRRHAGPTNEFRPCDPGSNVYK